MAADRDAARSRYRSTVQTGRWFFAFTLRRFSFFAAIKSDSTWRNYARILDHVAEGDHRSATALLAHPDRVRFEHEH